MAQQTREARNAKRRANYAKKFAGRALWMFTCLGCGQTLEACRPNQLRCKPCKRALEKVQLDKKRANLPRFAKQLKCCVCGRDAIGKQPNQLACEQCVPRFRLMRNYRRRKERMKTDPQFAAAQYLRNRVNNALAFRGAEKCDSLRRLVGCSKAELVAHIESKFRDGMTWETRGVKGWHIDHIIPCSAFDLTKPEEQLRCFHYTNLQPLWWHENMAKSNNIPIPEPR